MCGDGDGGCKCVGDVEREACDMARAMIRNCPGDLFTSEKGTHDGMYSCGACVKWEDKTWGGPPGSAAHGQTICGRSRRDAPAAARPAERGRGA